jgi:hypothetical protein
MSSFEIVVGRGRVSAPGLAKVDPSQLRDVIDIFVDGANVSARAPADRVYPVLRELAGAVLDLSAGTREKVVVPFHEAPYELVLERQGERALVTFYRGGNAPEVAIKDRPVELTALREAVSSAAANLCTRLWKDPNGDPRGEELLALCERTREGPVAPARPRPAGRSLVTVQSRSWSAAPAGAAVAFAFEAELPRVRRPDATLARADLHALLFAGRLVVHTPAQSTVFGRGYLFLRVERLLQACTHLAEAVEAGRATSVRLESDGFTVGLRREMDSTVLTLGTREMPVPLSVRGLSAEDVVEAAARLARELRRELAAVGEGKNLRVLELTRIARRAVSAVRGLRREKAVECGDPTPYRASVAREVPAERESLAGARRLGFVERWRL